MNTSRLADRLSWIVAGILVLLPFHALLTTWLGSNFGYLDAWRIWKELIIVILVFPVAYLIWQNDALKTWLKNDWLPRLILIYIFLHLIMGVWALQAGTVNTEALVYALLVNLRFLGFFIVTWVLASKSDFLKTHWKKIVLGPAVIVILFGLLQRFILPYDFLKHFGYGPETIPAYQTVDNKIDYRRIQSTLRGANPLGAYLVLMVPVLFFAIKKKNLSFWLTLAGAFLALFYSYSRSAWLGLLVTATLLIYWSVSNKKSRLNFLGISAGVVIVASGIVVGLRNSPVVQNTFFHTDSTSRSSDSSNEDRVEALKNGVRDVIHEPLGRGPGTAGPASLRNSHPTRISENYFLQIGQEIGWLGFGLFIAINILMARLLWWRRQEVLPRILLATLAGLTFINLVSHAWTDDTLAYIWWGLAGIALSPVILQANKQKHVQIKEKTAKRSN